MRKLSIGADSSHGTPPRLTELPISGWICMEVLDRALRAISVVTEHELGIRRQAKLDNIADPVDRVRLSQGLSLNSHAGCPQKSKNNRPGALLHFSHPCDDLPHRAHADGPAACSLRSACAHWWHTVPAQRSSSTLAQRSSSPRIAMWIRNDVCSRPKPMRQPSG